MIQKIVTKKEKLEKTRTWKERIARQQYRYNDVAKSLNIALPLFSKYLNGHVMPSDERYKLIENFIRNIEKETEK